MTVKTLRVIIVGGGIGGLSAAIALRQQGHDVTVYEQSPELKEVGAGLTLSPNATKALLSLGLSADLAALGSITNESATLHWQTGEVIRRRPMGANYQETYGAPYYHMHRADLHDALKKQFLKLAPNALQLDMRAVALKQTEEKVSVQFANGQLVSGDLVIGADGIRSAVYQHVQTAPAPNFTHRIAWRAILPGAVRQSLGLPKMASILGPERTISWYSLRNDDLLNIVMMAKSDEAADENWSAKADLDEVRNIYAGWCEIAQKLIAHLPTNAVMRWGLFDRLPYDVWGKGRVICIGDAVHPMLPYLGQGAAMAIEDAVILGRLLQNQSDVATALRQFPQIRKPRTDWIQLASRERGTFWDSVDSSEKAASPMADIHLKIYPYDACTAELSAEASSPI